MPSHRLGVFLLIILVLSAANAQTSSSAPDLILQGNDGFAYYLLRDENGQPAKSVDGFELYEGKKGSLQVNSSVGSLRKREHLLDGLPREHSKGWIPNAIQAKFSADGFVELLEVFRQHPDEFQKLFSGLTKHKVDLFKSIIFERKLVLTSQAMRELSRKAFATHAAPVKVPIYIEDDWFKKHMLDMITDIEGSKFTFYFRSKSIFFGPIKSKAFQAAILANPKLRPKVPEFKQGLRIHLAIQKAVLEGPTHDIGRIANLWEYDEAWRRSIGITQLDDLVAFFLRSIGSKERDLKNLVRFYDEQDMLIKGEIENLELNLGVSFEELVEGKKGSGLWKVNIEEPLALVSDSDAAVHLWFEKRPPPKDDSVFVPKPADDQDIFPPGKPWPVGLTEGAKDQIRSTLSSTLTEAFRSLYFANDLSIQIPLEAPYYERQFSELSGDVLSAGALPAASVDTKLSGVDILPDGIQISFDARLSLRRLANCVEESLQKILSRASSSEVSLPRSVPETGWTIASTVTLPLPRDPDDSSKEQKVAGPWGRVVEEGQNRVIDRSAEIVAKRGLIDLANLGAYAGGVYCASTRALWPRADYIPLITFRPHQPPQLDWSENALRLQVAGSLESFLPAPLSFGTDKKQTPRRVDSREIGFEGKFENDADDLSLQLDPITKLRISSFSAEETAFVERLLNLTGVSSRGSEGRAWSYQKFLNQLLNINTEDGSPIDLKSVEWSPNGLSFHLNLEDLGFITSLLNRPVKMTELVFSRAPGVPDLISTDKGIVELKWRGIERETLVSQGAVSTEVPSPLLVSFRQRLADGEWSPLSTPTASSSIHAFLEKPGRYHFEIYAMNRSFDWLPNAATYEVEFDPKRMREPVSTEKVDWKIPETSAIPKSTPDTLVHPTESAKGPFGCSISSGESVDPNSFLGSALALVSFLMLLRYRLRRPNSIVQ